MKKNTSLITRLDREDLDEATDVLAKAFKGDPLMEFLFPDDDASRRALMRFACQVRLELSWPLLGYWEDNKICGVAGLSIERDPAWPDQLSDHYTNLKNQIGPDGTERLENYSDIAEYHRPHEPNIYLGIIGVEPEKQGFGIGRALLENVQQFSLDHPTSTGVYLDTGNPENVEFYKHMGYRVTYEENISEMTLWCLYQPDDSEIHSSI